MDFGVWESGNCKPFCTAGLLYAMWMEHESWGKTQCKNEVNHENTEDAKDEFFGGKDGAVFAAGNDILTI